MTHSQLISQIAQTNRSAKAEYLAQFSQAELEKYLDRLLATREAFEAQFGQFDQLRQFDAHNPSELQLEPLAL